MIAWLKMWLAVAAVLFALVWTINYIIDADRGNRQAWDAYMRRNYGTHEH